MDEDEGDHVLGSGLQGQVGLMVGPPLHIGYDAGSLPALEPEPQQSRPQYTSHDPSGFLKSDPAEINVFVKPELSKMQRGLISKVYPTQMNLGGYPPDIYTQTGISTDMPIPEAKPRRSSSGLDTNLLSCGLCTYSSTKAFNIVRHMAKNHLGPDYRYNCVGCKRQFHSTQDLLDHRKGSHGSSYHECDICGHQTAQNQGYTIHRLKHEGFVKHGCSYCTATFDDKENLQIHISTHQIT